MGAGNRQSAGGDERAWLARLLILAALVYSFSLRNEFVFDDEDLIVNNHYLGSWSFVWKSLVNDSWWFRNPLHPPVSSYYRPLQDLWLALNFQLFGARPAGWHTAMVAVHLIVVWLVFRVAALLCADRRAGLLAAALFALMPIHAEAVVRPSAISQPLNAAFELAAFEFYLRGFPGPGADAARRRWRALSLGLFAGALLGYEGAITFPVLIAVHAFLYSALQKGKELEERARTAIAAAWPYALEVAAYLGVRLWVLGFISQPNPLSPPTAMETALTIPAAIAAYAMLLAMPWRAGPAHHLSVVRSVAEPGLSIPVAAIAALCAAAFLLLRRHPHRRLYLFCAAWILLGLAPVLDLRVIGIQSGIQDRYLYLPSMGLCVVVADLALDFARGDQLRAAAVWSGAAAVAIGLAASLVSAQRVWHDDVTLFSRAVEQFPQAALWHNRLGMTLMARGNLADARREFERAVALDPDDGASLYDLGLVNAYRGDPRAAARAIAEGLERLKYRQPAQYAQLAFAADAAGDRAGAETALKQAAALGDGAAIATLARAQLFFRHGDSQSAEQATRDLLRHLPDDAETLAAIGAELSSEHRWAESLEPYRRAARIAPNDSGLHYRLAFALHQLGREREAYRECAIVLADSPSDRGARVLMAAIERGGGNR